MSWVGRQAFGRADTLVHQVVQPETVDGQSEARHVLVHNERTWKKGPVLSNDLARPDPDVFLGRICFLFKLFTRYVHVCNV